ncbi:MAG: hypothetical protein RLZZ484_1107 [Pseudomonadota bacterium]|jgi:uncharacterized SAM-binding protein YcdF (DUF218 family)
MSALKPLLTALVLPPAGPLLLLAAGLWLGRISERRRVASRLCWAAVAMLWLLSCQSVAVGLSRFLLPSFLPASPAQVATTQAIVVLGGGVRPGDRARQIPDELALEAHERVLEGARLARDTRLPLAFSGGQGWGVQGQSPNEAEVASQVLWQDHGLKFQWLEAGSRDTRENAQMTAKLLLPQNIQHIALVTQSWHLPRSVRNFEEAGFKVLPVPTGIPRGSGSPWLDALPSAQGLSLSRQVLREWLGLRLT